MLSKYMNRSIFAAVAIAVGSLAPLPAMAGGYGYGGGGDYDQPSYQPHYKPHYKPAYHQYCYYKRVHVYDEYSHYWVWKKVKVCN